MSLSATSIPSWFDLGSALNRKRLRRVIQFVLGPALLIAVWWVAYAGTLVDPHLLPSPFATLADTWKNIASGAMTKDFLQTLLREILGHRAGRDVLPGIRQRRERRRQQMW